MNPKYLYALLRGYAVSLFILLSLNVCGQNINLHAYTIKIANSQNLCAGTAAAPFKNVGDSLSEFAVINYQWEINNRINNPKWKAIKNGNQLTYRAGILTSNTQFRRADFVRINGSVIKFLSNIITVTINETPKASFEITSDLAQSLDTNHFDLFNTSSWSEFGWTTSYHWNFGDGTQDESCVHFKNKRFKEIGIFPVRLIAIGYNGCSDTTLQQVYILAVKPNGMSGSNMSLSKANTDKNKSNERPILSTELELYPNPNNGSFNIHCKDLALKMVNVSIINLLGIEVFQCMTLLDANGQTALGELNLKGGTYKFILTSDNKMVIEKSLCILK